MRTVIYRALFLAICLGAALLPLLERPAPGVSDVFPGWPTQYEGRTLVELPVNEREALFNAGFPGKIARFSDGEREFIFRWVRVGSRKLHSSADCFRGLSYSVSPAPALRDGAGRPWSCFTATSAQHRLHVREQISDPAGQLWTDVSAWFWSVTLRQTQGPWMAVTIIEAK